MERRAREPVAMLTCCELIRRDAVLKFLTFAIRIPEAGTVRKRHMASSIVSVTSTTVSALVRFVITRTRPPLCTRSWKASPGFIHNARMRAPVLRPG